MCLWSNRHQVRLKLKDWKTKFPDEKEEWDVDNFTNKYKTPTGADSGGAPLKLEKR